jgi:nucleotide-binding universal stress UspA family protein
MVARVTLLPVGHHGDGPALILVAIDGSETSMRAGAYAAGLARRQHARLVCLFVRTGSSLASLNPGLAAPLRQAGDALAAQLREAVLSNAERLGIDAVFVERQGSPGAEIARVADELTVDGVVVGASTRAGHRFVGSIATHLVRIARWPVTVVP